MKRQISKRARSGLTLIEVMVGSMVFFIAVMAIFYAMPVLDKNAREARQRSLATLAARAEIEQCKSMASSLTFGTTEFTLPPDVSGKGTVEVRGQNRLLEVTVQVVWGSWEGQRIVLSTMIRR